MKNLLLYSILTNIFPVVYVPTCLIICLVSLLVQERWN